MTPVDEAEKQLQRDSASLWHRYRSVYSAERVDFAVVRQLVDRANRYAAHHIGVWPEMRGADSDHFRALFRKIVPEMYPAVQRLFFIHIPRTAGSDLREALRSSGEAVINHDIDRPWSPAMSDHLARLDEAVRAVESGAGRICLVGHYNPEYYRRLGLIRKQDIIFCIARDPFEIALSHLKFEARMLQIDPALHRPGAREFAARFGVTGSPSEDDPSWKALIDALLEKRLDAVAAGKFSSMEPYRRLLSDYTERWCLEAPDLLPVPMRAVHYSDYGSLKRHLGLDESTRRNYTQDLSMDFSDARCGIAEIWRSEYRLYETLSSAPVRLFPDEFPAYFA